MHWHGVAADVICLPHPSGVSTWHRGPPGSVLLAQALQLVARHPVFVAALAGPAVLGPVGARPAELEVAASGTRG